MLMDLALVSCLICFSILIIAGDATNWTCSLQLYQFGDSYADTGNFVRSIPGTIISRLPYGETFPGTPTGRSSNGRLIIDYIAMNLGLPLLNPYLDRKASFSNGVNFAVAGAAALDLVSLASIGVVVPPAPGETLSLQLDWFHTYLPSICSDPQASARCFNVLKRAIFIVGEFGINDIKNQLQQTRRSLDQIRATVPSINEAIVNATRVLIQAGASQVVVPGNFPLGCYPFGIAALPTNDPNAYDALGCLKSLNSLVMYENSNLQSQLLSLRNQYPGVTIIYLDNYNAFLSVFASAPHLGFDPTTLRKPCCGTNDFRIISPRFCGNPGVPVCPNPEQYISWDGIHLTQRTYSLISQIVIPKYILPAAVAACSP